MRTFTLVAGLVVIALGLSACTTGNSRSALIKRQVECSNDRSCGRD